MENQEKEKGQGIKITNADCFSTLALIGFLALTWSGFSFKYEWGLSFCYAFLSFALAVGLLVLLKWIKRRDEKINQWKIVEIIVAILTFAVFIFFMDIPMIRTLSIIFVNKENLQTEARADIDSMRVLFTKYEMNEEEAIKKTQNILRSYYYYPKIEPALLQSFFNRESCYSDDVKAYVRARYNDYLSKDGPMADMEATGIEGDYKTFKDEMLARIDLISTDVEEFGFFSIPGLGHQNGDKSIQKAGSDIVSYLEKKRTKKNPDGYYFLFDSELSVVPAEPYVFESRFKPALDSSYKIWPTDYFRLWLPVLLSIILNLLMFFSYFVSYRSSKVEIARRNKSMSKSKPLGGVIIG